MGSKLIEIDDFGRSMKQLLAAVENDVDKGSTKAVRKAAQKGKRNVVRNAKKAGLERVHDGPHYVDGWSYRVKNTEEGPTAEIGNKTKPGLAHLLEKGHAKVGGGMVPGVEHIAPAAETTFEEFVKLMNEEVKL